MVAYREICDTSTNLECFSNIRPIPEVINSIFHTPMISENFDLHNTLAMDRVKTKPKPSLISSKGMSFQEKAHENQVMGNNPSQPLNFQQN